MRPSLALGAALGALVSLLAVSLPRVSHAAYTRAAEGGAVAVTTDQSEATRAALETLHAGGNAVDAAITAALALGVVNPVASGIGGGGFALVYLHRENKVVALDFRETAPAGADVDSMLTKMGWGAPPEYRGLGIGVPGEPAGLELMSMRYARRSLAADAAPAAELAARGFPLGKHMATALGMFKDYVAVSPDLARALLPGGSPLPYRTVVRRPELARTILRFGSEGARPFYSGAIGQQIVAAARSAGSQMTMQDLRAYTVRERAPLAHTFGDGPRARTVYTMPAPSAGGLMLLESLGMYGADRSSPLAPAGFGSSAYLHTIAEAMRGAVADRARAAGDPDLEPSVAGSYAHFLAPEQLAARRARIEPGATHAAPEFKTIEGGTTHLIVGDAEGNVVSMTTTVNGPFGARVVAGDSGVLLNDELTDFSKPEDTKGFGVIGLGPNRPRGRARPVSSMTPTIVVEGHEAILAVGGSGGQHIATEVTQATLARLVFDLDPGACVAAPRIFVNGSGPDVYLEPEFAEDVRAGLRARGESPKDDKMLMTGVHMVAWDHQGPGGAQRVIAAADPRKHGLALAQ